MKAFKATKGLNADVVRMISQTKQEPEWMTHKRLDALAIFERKPLPSWGADLRELDHHDIHYYVSALDEVKHTWDDVPDKIKNTFERLGIPQAERSLLAGVGAQYESEVIYKSLHESLKAQGVVFCDMNTALREYPALFNRYFGTVIPAHDNKFAALNTAVWSGGSFVYVPQGVRIELPLQAYFRINSPKMGQFERTLIVAEPDSFVHYVEGCSAPVYRSNSLHSAVVEIIAHERSQVRYTTIQNWSENVYNLVTKRAIAHEEATVEWIDGNFGSKVTMKYPAIILKGRRAKGMVISLAVASKGQQQDAGAKMIHLAPDTTSTIIAKSISKEGGQSSYRGLVKVAKGALRTRSMVQCDALLLDPHSRSDTYPTIDIQEPHATVGHEASVSKVSEQQLFYLMSRGLSQAQAQTLIINGFIDCFVSTLPMEYAVEINRLIALEMEGSIG